MCVTGVLHNLVLVRVCVRMLYAQLFQTDSGCFDCRRWAQDKEELLKHNPFAALPYLIDGQTVVATAPASSDYLAHKLGTECVSAVRVCMCMYSHCKQTTVYAAPPHFLAAV